MSQFIIQFSFVILTPEYPQRSASQIFPLLVEILNLSSSLPVDHEFMCHLVENLSASVEILRGAPNTSNGSRTGTSSSTSIIPFSVTKSLPSSVPVPSNSRSALSNSALPTTSRRRACDDGEEGSSGHSNRPKLRRMRSDAISNAGGQSTHTTRSVDSDIRMSPFHLHGNPNVQKKRDIF